MTKITAYKGFNADMTCRGFQFEVGKTYTHKGTVAACRAGFHACENPMDGLEYYPIIGDDGSLTRFAEVEVSGDASRDGNKIAAAEITIKAELRLPDFVRRAVNAVIAVTKGKADDHSGNDAQLAASGDYAQLAASGDYAKLAASGYGAQVTCEGDNAIFAGSGRRAKVRGNVGTWISIASFGDDGKCNGFGTGCIGQDGLKPDTWYRAENGKLVEW